MRQAGRAIPAAQMRLICLGHELSDDFTLQECDARRAVASAVHLTFDKVVLTSFRPCSHDTLVFTAAVAIGASAGP